VTELHEAVLFWVQARQAAAVVARLLAPFLDPSSEPFPPIA
jgi:hypothetical protein